MKSPRSFAPVVLLLASACAHHPEAVAVLPPPVVPTIVAAPMPAGGYPGMVIPVALPDGGYATPNRALSEAAAAWHLRAALNVAALACRGPGDAARVAAYNALLTTHKAELKAAEATLAAEFRAGGGDWQDRYDDAMTRLYNYFSQSFARDGFCRAADDVLASAAAAPQASVTTIAATRLVDLDRPFTDFYHAYDLWRAGTMARPVIALAATTPTQPAAAPTSAPAPRPTPHLQLDLSALGDD